MNKASNGLKNVCGNNIGILRQALPGNISQRRFSEMLCLNGLDVDKNFVSRIERGVRPITDLELMHICEVLDVTYEDLFRGVKK